jgi:hypothetical protein
MSSIENRAKGLDIQIESHKESAVVSRGERDLPEKTLSSLERLPYEVMDLIFSQVPRASLVACALTSTRLHFLASEALYTTVYLESSHFTRIFAQTLEHRPFLCDYVQELTVTVEPHWRSVRRLHDILKKLPRLIYLHVLPCWITYGDLPYWEYPFKLRKIKWGLIKDRASQKFIKSHSDTLKEVGYIMLEVT